MKNNKRLTKIITIKVILINSLMILSTSAFATVSVVDVGSAGIRATEEMASDSATMANYMTSITNTMGKIQKTMSAADQLKNLQGLQKLNAGGQICELCNASDYKALQDYRQSINTDLCGQFSNAFKNLTGVTNAANSLQDIMSLLTSDPKAAALSLQQASVSSAQTMNSTLAQMQLLQAQAQQKQLADEKAGQQVTSQMIRINPGL